VSRLSHLLVELCPRGVEFKELREIFSLRNGYTPSKSNKSFWTDGTVPWFRMEDIRENGRILSGSLQRISQNAVKGGNLFPANSLLVATSATIGEHALITVPHLSNQRFTSLTLKPEFADQLDIKFAFYYCFVLDEWCRNNTTTSSFSSVDMNGFRKFRFPIPPLAVQREIVRVLDAFTQLEAELEAELEGRRQQYQYYRDTLFSFTELEQASKQASKQATTAVEWKALNELGAFIRGNGLQKKDFSDSGVGCIHYGQIHTHYGVWTAQTIAFVTPTLAKRLRRARSGDLVIATTSEDDEAVGKAVAWLGAEDVAVSSDAYIYRHSLNPKYVSFFFQSKHFQSQKKSHITGTKVRRLSGESLGQIRIPVPSPEVQARVVEILDRFDALVSDISIGLPAELRARRQQYEYYRDLLLTFREAA
jgi:type I restriction enzyme, S subunit